jgi:hypothetical protein
MATPEYYWTQYANDTSSLDELVNKRIIEGWQLHGSAYVAIHPDKDPLFCQPMKRERGRKETGAFAAIRRHRKTS